MVKKAKPRTRTDAESLAVEALNFIASDAERLGGFLAATGIGPADIRVAAREPLFLAGVLDHLANNETDLVAFAKQSGLEPQEILHAREQLAGRSWERDTP